MPVREKVPKTLTEGPGRWVINPIGVSQSHNTVQLEISWNHENVAFTKKVTMPAELLSRENVEACEKWAANLTAELITQRDSLLSERDLKKRAVDALCSTLLTVRPD